MADLLQKQIQESCKLALPEGLKDLMSDISREVLRAQPRDLYKFIASYLQSLLEVREALVIACRICKETCECACEFDIFEELRIIGLNEENVEKAVDIIEGYFKKETVKEQSLFLKLMRKINIEEKQVGALKNIVQRAFHQYRPSNIDTENDESEENNAAQHTLGLYNKNIGILGNINSAKRPNLKTVSSISLAGSYACPQSSERSVDPAALSKISEECASLDYTKNMANKMIQDLMPGVKFSLLYDTKHTESSSSSELDIKYHNKQNTQRNKEQDILISDDEEVEEIQEEERVSTESSIIEESLLNSPGGSDD